MDTAEKEKLNFSKYCLDCKLNQANGCRKKLSPKSGFGGKIECKRKKQK